MADSEGGTGFDASSGDRASVLLLAPPADDGVAAYCRDHLAPGPGHEATPIIVLTDNPPAERSSGWNDGWGPGVVVAIGDSTRSTVVEAPAPVAPTSPPETVPATGDFGSVGRTVDDHVTAWSASGRRPVVCVDSLEGLIEHGPIGDVYRFLYVLLHRVEETGGVVHVHADPRRYEEEILRTFYSLFDRVVTFQDGSTPL